MDNISKKDISFRLDKIKDRVNVINNQMTKNNKEMESKYEFAKTIGVKYDTKYATDDIASSLNDYIQKADDIIAKLSQDESEENEEEYKILNNILYLDDIKLSNIEELVDENREIRVKEYINKIAEKANSLIRDEEIRNIDFNIVMLSRKSNLFEKITGKDKNKKILLENYNLKRVETMNKKYIPENKSILDIVNIVKNCGYKTDDISEFIEKLSKEYELGDMIENALVVPNSELKIPLFYNKEFASKINAENSTMLERINSKKKCANKQDYNPYGEMLKDGVSTLELFNFNGIIDEVV